MSDTPEGRERRLVAVLTRAIPVSDYGQTDTVIRVCEPGESIEAVMAWAEKHARGMAVLIRLEITRETP